MMKLIFVFIISLMGLNAQDTVNKNPLWNPVIIEIDNISDNTSTLKNNNLKVGQSGIVVHVYKNNNKIIIANAKVIYTNENKSIVEYTPFNDLKQKSMPTSNRKVEVKDILILNYLYTSSMIIAPTQESFLKVRNKFKYNNFLHPDLFATNLKMKDNPFPSKQDIQDYAISQNLGTIFLVLKDSVNILDSKTFKLLDKQELSYKKKDLQKPFYSRVEKIESGSFDFDFTDKESLTYTEYYNQTLGLR